MDIRDDNYINIQGWMCTQLHLSGEQLLIYAIIYGFSQDGKGRCVSGIDYFMEWCGTKTRKTLDNYIYELLDRELIYKETIKDKKGIHNEYYVNLQKIKNLDLKENVRKEHVQDREIVTTIKKKDKPKTELKVKHEKLINKYLDKFRFKPEIEDLLFTYFLSLEQNKKFPTDISLESQLGKLDLLSDKPEIQQTIINKTIENNWNSLIFLTDKYFKDNNLVIDQVENNISYRQQFDSMSDENISKLSDEILKDYIKKDGVPQDIKDRLSRMLQNRDVSDIPKKIF